MTRALILAAFLALAGCAGGPAPEPRVVTHDVLIPTPVACKPNIGPAPAYPDTASALRAAPDFFERVKLIVAGRIMRIARERELQAALDACRG